MCTLHPPTQMRYETGFGADIVLQCCVFVYVRMCVCVCVCVCVTQEHWFTIRRVGDTWYNFNSVYPAPEVS